MNIQRVKGVLLSIIAASLFAVGFTTTVNATPAISVWANGSNCGLWDGDGNVVTSDSFHIVITNSKDGNTIITCQAQDIENSSGVAVHYDINNHPPGPFGDQCAFSIDGVFYYSDDWQETVSASGNATARCKLEGIYYLP